MRAPEDIAERAVHQTISNRRNRRIAPTMRTSITACGARPPPTTDRRPRPNHVVEDSERWRRASDPSRGRNYEMGLLERTSGSRYYKAS